MLKIGTLVALRKESVDRNMTLRHCTTYLNWSLSARRAWIEICTAETDITLIGNVALRKESVDRNRSPIKCAICRIVALRKESVDRNWA